VDRVVGGTSTPKPITVLPAVTPARSVREGAAAPFARLVSGCRQLLTAHFDVSGPTRRRPIADAGCARCRVARPSPDNPEPGVTLPTDRAKIIVIVGGGFAGTTLARALDGKLPDGYELVLVSEESYTTFNLMLP
jgi:hypothetical protein